MTKLQFEVNKYHVTPFDIVVYKRYGDRIQSACLIGASLWPLSRLEKVLPYYEKKFDERDKRERL